MVLNINYFLTGRGILDDAWSPYIYTQFLSYNRHAITHISTTDKYLFKVHKDIIGNTLTSQLRGKPTAFRGFIRKSKVDEEPLFFKVKQYYHWTDSEAKQIWRVMKPIIYGDKAELRQYYKKFGIDKKFYEQHDIEWKPREKVGLESWMK